MTARGRLVVAVALGVVALGTMPYEPPPPLTRLMKDIRDKPIGPNQIWFGTYYRPTDKLYVSKWSKTICWVEDPTERACNALMNMPVDDLHRMRWKLPDGRRVHVAKCLDGPWLYLVCPVPTDE